MDFQEETAASRCPGPTRWATAPPNRQSPPGLERDGAKEGEFRLDVRTAVPFTDPAEYARRLAHPARCFHHPGMEVPPCALPRLRRRQWKPASARVNIDAAWFREHIVSQWRADSSTAPLAHIARRRPEPWRRPASPASSPPRARPATRDRRCRLGRIERRPPPVSGCRNKPPRRRDRPRRLRSVNQACGIGRGVVGVEVNAFRVGHAPVHQGDGRMRLQVATMRIRGAMFLPSRGWRARALLTGRRDEEGVDARRDQGEPRSSSHAPASAGAPMVRR